MELAGNWPMGTLAHVQNSPAIGKGHVGVCRKYFVSSQNHGIKQRYLEKRA